MKNVSVEMEVSSLIKLVKGSLESLVPWLKKAHILNEQLNGYDSWDNIQEAIFEEMVVTPFLESYHPEHHQGKTFYPYGFREVEFKDKYFVLAKTRSEHYLFLDFKLNTNGQMDQIFVAKILTNGKLASEEVLDFSDTKFEIGWLVDDKVVGLSKINIIP